MKIKIGYQLMAYDFIEKNWVKTEIIFVNTVYPSYVTLQFIEGDQKGFKWKETFEYLNNSDHYRECAGLDPAPPGYWTDPAGGIHHEDDDDPAAMYE
jgi:hypothetical protein